MNRDALIPDTWRGLPRWWIAPRLMLLLTPVVPVLAVLIGHKSGAAPATIMVLLLGVVVVRGVDQRVRQSIPLRHPPRSPGYRHDSTRAHAQGYPYNGAL